jgi:cell division initiation protein
VKITPLDIRRKEFKRSMRGYSDEEVDIFLDEVADEFERLFQENMEMQDRMQRLEEQVAGHAQIKDALEKTLVSAQLQSDEIRANARKEGELILRDAELKARHIVNDSYGETQRVQQALVQLKHLEEDFRFKFRSLLEGHLKLLSEAPIVLQGGEQIGEPGEPVADEPVTPELVAVEPVLEVSQAASSRSTETVVSHPPPAAGEPSSQADDDVPTEETTLGVEEPGVAEAVAEDSAAEPAAAEPAAEEPAVEEPDAAELVAELVGLPGEIPAAATDAPAPGAVTGETDATRKAADNEPSRGSFFFGRRLDDDDIFPAPETDDKEKGRDFEW